MDESKKLTFSPGCWLAGSRIKCVVSSIIVFGGIWFNWSGLYLSGFIWSFYRHFRPHSMCNISQFADALEVF